jgi:hypothetical protein
MPQASDELRKLVHWIIQPKADVVVTNDQDVCEFLQERGYTLMAGFEWKVPKSADEITEMEWLCIRYLIEEWDYGGLADTRP